MSDETYVNVTFYILGDVIDDQIYDQIIGALSKIAGIISVSHLQKTNTIEVSAKWNELEFDKKIESIRKIANVKDIKIYKKNRLFTRSIIDSVTVSEKVSWNLEKDFVNEITRARDARDYYKALSLSCTAFGHYGKEILLSQLKDTRTATSKKFERINLNCVIIMLYTHKIIDESMYNKIEKVRKLRNVFQHEDRTIRYSLDQAQEAERIIDNALDCVKFLKIKYDTR
jgi:hypothetical protein